MIGRASYNRLLDEIDSMGIIDIHTHIDPAHPTARGPWEILLYHYVTTELRSAGVPADLLSEERDMEEKVVGVVPYLQLIKNTTTYWCLSRILKDLYGFEEELKETNYPALRERIVEEMDNSGRAEFVLRKRGRMRRTFLTFDYAREPPEHDGSLFIGALRIEPLIGRLSPSSVKNLVRATSSNIESLDDFDESLARLFKKFRGCAAVTASFLPSEIFIKPDRVEAERVFKELVKGSEPTPVERRTLTSYALQSVLRSMVDEDVTFQMMLGVERPVLGASPPDYAVVALEPRMVTSYCQIFHEFRDVNFDIFLANRLQSQELSVIAKNYPNVYVSGYWWYNLYPTIIREILRERLQMLPIRKTNGFFSDAYVAEWSYGKSCLIKSQIAYVLAEMVDDGFYSMETAKELAADLLERNPARLYHLAE